MAISRDDIAAVLDEIALLLEIKGENPFKTRAYRNGAETVRNYDGDIVKKAAANELDGIKGIGKALQEKLHELASTGELKFHQNLRAEFPEGLFDLFGIQGLGPKKVRALYDQLGVDSIEALKTACTDGSAAGLPGFGKKSIEKLLEAIALKEQFADLFRLGDIAPIAESMLENLRQHPDSLRVEIAGSYRRSKEVLHDIDFLVATPKPAEMTEYFSQLPEVDSVIVCGSTKASVRLANGLQCDLRAVSNEQFPFALQYFSGSKEHNVALRSRALKHGWSLNEYGFTPKDKTSPAAPAVKEEADIYRILELDRIPPELRENRGEIEAAEAGEIPRLVELENLRGTFHNHTTASDGKNTLEEMAEAARDLGLQYLGIADHSKSQFQANGLYPDRLLKQVAAIQELNQSWDDFQIFTGTEVDILKDGSLDFEDDVLEQLDYSVASIHGSFQLPEKEMTARIIKAMENPHVTMIGHLTGRLLLRREGYAVDVDKVIDCAIRTGTIIELNCNPRRLDMDWRHWQRARDKGLMTSINPDAHATEQLQYLAYGIRLARKGWLRREDVLNCMTLDEVQRWLKLPKEQRMRA
ncbi:DNA polymerase/3'-5' exonuclease PolX [Verrucomicrobiaceae bacterium 5K15]|uniref:DNA polymerase beta n=1 Tax=Oceaniferula flava TaxID=2800421 RepID=A0AAE2SAV9_9BACT|nr:DNA polymerase/3'-5' exonuclease PolX [Oceaniferula flavus]MBK1855033.1 DNA polymerase/3'-5' exonuclease PolX [Oceaniferula flavus]MBM1136339.1 DNA polymerase/3'-5' exonuclease PolX [Oceaniferula flavus]